MQGRARGRNGDSDMARMGVKAALALVVACALAGLPLVSALADDEAAVTADTVTEVKVFYATPVDPDPEPDPQPEPAPDPDTPNDPARPDVPNGGTEDPGLVPASDNGAAVRPLPALATSEGPLVRTGDAVEKDVTALVVLATTALGVLVVAAMRRRTH